MLRNTVGLAFAASLLATAAAAQPQLSEETLKYVSVNAPVVAITHAKLVDGTGTAPKLNQTVVIQGGVIAAVGPDRKVKIPNGAQVIDGTGKTVIPGLVHMHEHLFYPMLPGKAYGYEAETFSKLYLAGGVTSMRTAGAMHFAGDLHVRDAINAGPSRGRGSTSPGPTSTGQAPSRS
ncbi:hypothetical protein [Phenylobacterium sp. J367]|uniref:amidohydrolase family protein n=1 Tax=Phenylobacterium sp. J367 TaxID=2898435 RepID=UPI0021517A3B|nr:hypothetical protein [Phenylobacterium sp. J367]MCR5877393.1 hypothetical protein [Phenylobacterium sp. J367]